MNAKLSKPETSSHTPAVSRWPSKQQKCSFFSNCGAATMLEFGLLAPIFFGILLEILQMGLYFYISSTVDYATNMAARNILTGAIGNQNLNAAQFRTNIICPLLPVAFSGSSCANTLVVNLVDLPIAQSPSGFYTLVNAAKSGLIRPVMNNAGTQFCPGFSAGINQNTGAASVEVLQVYYPMPIISIYWASAMSTNLNGQLVYYVGSVAAFQNEPYFASTQSGGC